MIILLLIGITLKFPQDSREWAHYLAPAVASQVAFELTDFTIHKVDKNVDEVNRQFWGIVVGGLVGTSTILILKNHYATEDEQLLGANGVLHWQALRLTFLLIKLKWN